MMSLFFTLGEWFFLFRLEIELEVSLLKHVRLACHEVFEDAFVSSIDLYFRFSTCLGHHIPDRPSIDLPLVLPFVLVRLE